MKKSENTIVSLYNPLYIRVLNIVFSVLLKYRIQRQLLKMIKSTEQFLDKGSVKRETTDITERVSKEQLLVISHRMRPVGQQLE